MCVFERERERERERVCVCVCKRERERGRETWAAKCMTVSMRCDSIRCATRSRLHISPLPDRTSGFKLWFKVYIYTQTYIYKYIHI